MPLISCRVLALINGNHSTQMVNEKFIVKWKKDGEKMLRFSKTFRIAFLNISRNVKYIIICSRYIIHKEAQY